MGTGEGELLNEPFHDLGEQLRDEESSSSSSATLPFFS